MPSKKQKVEPAQVPGALPNTLNDLCSLKERDMDKGVAS